MLDYSNVDVSILCLCANLWDSYFLFLYLKGGPLSVACHGSELGYAR